MQFVSFASSSKGNCHMVMCEELHPLLLEAGIPISFLRNKLREYGTSLSDIEGCLVSHEHKDHAKAVKDLLKAGIDVWMSDSTAMALGVVDHHRLHTVFRQGFHVGYWLVIPFDLEHDAADPKGYYIIHKQDRLLFIPDTAYVENRFEGPTIIAVECNNIAELLTRNILEGNLPAVVGKRVRRSHMSLENLIAMLKANDLSRCQRIYLMHLSDGNSDERRMIQEVQRATGVPVWAA